MLTFYPFVAIIVLVVNFMRYVNLRDMRDKLKDKGIPEYADMLKRKYGYDADERKRRLNPRELELIDDARRRTKSTRRTKG